MRLAFQNRFDCSEEEAIVRLQRIWDNNENNSPRNTPRPPSPPPPPLTPPPPDPIPAPPPESHNLPTDFDHNEAIPNTVPNMPLKWAVNKVKAGEYVQLWYFTSKGMLEAKKSPKTTPDDTLDLLKTETGFTLQQVKASKPSRNAIDDEYLRWEQIMTARHKLCDAAAGWPENLRISLAAFYLNLEALRGNGINHRPLILYQATT